MIRRPKMLNARLTNEEWQELQEYIAFRHHAVTPSQLVRAGLNEMLRSWREHKAKLAAAPVAPKAPAPARPSKKSAPARRRGR